MWDSGKIAARVSGFNDGWNAGVLPAGCGPGRLRGGEVKGRNMRMNTVGQAEKKTQDRVLALFQERLGYCCT